MIVPARFMVRSSALFVFAVAAFVGCGGSPGPQALPAGQPAPAAQGGAAHATLTIHIPAAATQSSGRNPQFISPSTNGMLVTTYVNPASTHPTPIATAAIDLSAASGKCTPSTGGGRTCTASMAVSPGTDDFVFASYDAAPVAGGFAGAHQLGAATVANVTIVAGGSNTINIAVGGVVASVTLSAATVNIDGSSPLPSPIPVSFTALDAAGNTILAGMNSVTNGGTTTTDTYANPIALAIVETGATGHAKLVLNGGAPAANVTVQRSSDTVGLTYDGLAATSAYTLAIGATAAGATPSSLALNVVPATVTIPLTIETSPVHGGSGPGPNSPLVMVSVGGASPVPMLLDTGSSGLRVFADKVGPAVTLTSVSNAESFGAGVSYFGVQATSPKVTVGGVAFVQPVTFQVVQAVCPTGTGTPSPGGTCGDGSANQIPSIEAGGKYGILGARLDAGSGNNGIHTPLVNLPFNLASGFIVSLGRGTSPTLTLGLTAANTTGFQTTNAVGKSTFSSGDPAFKTSRIPFCYSFTGPGAPNPQPSECLTQPIAGNSDPGPGALSDTGAASMALAFPTAMPAGIATTGYPVTVTLPGSTIGWTFTLASSNVCNSWNGGSIVFRATNSETQGALPFYRNDVLFDVRDGLFGYRPSNTSPPAFCP